MSLERSDELVDPPTLRADGVWRRLRRDRFAVAGGIVVVLYILVALTAPLITRAAGVDPYTYDLASLDGRGAPAGGWGGISSDHWFGVQPLTGRDLFAIVLVGSRASLVVGLGATALSVALGTVLGLLAGWFGGAVDWVIARGIDVLIGLPALIFMIAVGAVAPAWLPRLLLLVLIIGFFGWTTIARVVRGQVMSLRSSGFVRASQALGAGHAQIIFRHLLPNLAATIVVFATIAIPGAIGAEAALSFLGVGVPAPTPSWGRSIGDAVTWFSVDPMYLVFPGAALFVLTLAFNAFGDGLRDALDPRTSRHSRRDRARRSPRGSGRTRTRDQSPRGAVA
ncbi:ABC transporter permease [Aestuariimicrobium kwangyangense]|uniref:ABC transporter permease n=1 Tax=Aestuariimicrobium kwangyangense TaxID=396389 RepID=UPI0003B6CEDF|nr:ABC transporter permease [Aestuariimicrobium kwangyangense]